MVTRNWDRVPVYGWYYKAPGTPDQGARLTFTITGAPHGVKRVDGRAIYRAGATQEVAVGKTEDQDPDVRNRVRQALRDRDEATLGEAFDGIAWDAAWDAALPAAVFTSFYAQDDPDVTPQGFQISVTEATSGARRTYPIDLRLAMIDATPVPGLNLADVELPAGTPVTPAPTYAKGQPGGVAPLDGDGLVPTEHLPGGGGGAVQVFGTLAEAQAWEASGPGRVGLFITTGSGNGGGTPPPSTSGALDSISIPHRALSLRRTLTSYTGPLIRVRRTDGAEQDITAASDGSLDTAALTAFVGSGDGTVATWYDQSGQGRHLSAVDVAAQPRIVSAGVLETMMGKPAVAFSGSQMLSSTTVGLYAAGQASAAIVMSGQPAAESALFSEREGTWAFYRVLRSSTQRWNVQAMSSNGTSMWASSASGDTTFDGNPHRLFYVDSGSSINTWRDGAAAHTSLTANRSAILTPTTTQLGAHQTNTGLTAGFAGRVQEVVTWADDLTTERAAVLAAQAYWMGG